MRKYGKQTLDSLRQDRLNGYTVSKLITKYSIPKTSIWHHIQNLKLSDDARRIINSSRGGSAVRARGKWQAADAKASELLQNFDERTVWPALLTAFYWAEGTKSSFVFTNTDEAMIRIFLKLVRKYLNIQNKDIDVLIRICKPMKPEQCRRYWSGVTNISFRNIRINSHDAYNKSTTVHGMCRITFRTGGDNLKLIHCLIRGLTAKMLSSESSRSSTDRTSHS